MLLSLSASTTRYAAGPGDMQQKAPAGACPTGALLDLRLFLRVAADAKQSAQHTAQQSGAFEHDHLHPDPHLSV